MVFIYYKYIHVEESRLDVFLPVSRPVTQTTLRSELVELGRHRPLPWHRTRNRLRLGASKADRHSGVSGSVGHIGPASDADM